MNDGIKESKPIGVYGSPILNAWYYNVTEQQLKSHESLTYNQKHTSLISSIQNSYYEYNNIH